MSFETTTNLNHEDLLRAKWDKNSKRNDLRGMTAASTRGDKKILKLMLEYPMDPRGKYGLGSKPLFQACVNNHSGCVSLLLQHGANLPDPHHHTDFKQNNHRLKSMVKCVNASVLQAFYKYDIRLARLRIFGAPFLCCAILDRHPNRRYSKVKYLIDQGANVNSRDSGMGTALHYAVKTGNLKLVKLLIRAGCNVNAATSRELPLLVDRQVVIKSSHSRKRKTPLDIAIQRKHEEVVHYLKKKGGVCHRHFVFKKVVDVFG